MERRRVPDPKVRQVGFVTPGTTDLVNLAGGTVVEGASPSPVLIPPVRIADEPTVVVPVKAAPVPVPSPTSKRHADVTVPLGSFNPDSVLGSSDTPSSKFGSHGERLMSSSTFLEHQSEASDFLTVGSSTMSTMFVPMRVTSLPTGVSNPPSGSSPNNTVSLPVDKGKSQKAVQDEQLNEKKPLKERTSKAERRAAQEAQRASKQAARAPDGSGATAAKAAVRGGSQAQSAKAAKPAQVKRETSEKRSSSVTKSSEKGTEKEKKKDAPAPPRFHYDDAERVAKAKKRSLVEQTETKNRVELFRHLPQFVHGTQLPSLESKFFHDEAMHPHPAVYKVGLQYLTGELVGGNARCMAMLLAFRDMIHDYSTPPEKLLIRDLTQKINSNVSFLNTCRPLAISMGNAIKFLKTKVVNLPDGLSEADAKATLIGEIDRFIQEKILYADKEIVKHAVQKIRDGDVCLTYGFSCVVEMILLKAHKLGKKFRVVVVDARPKLEGKKLLKKLLSEGLDCTYTHINAVSYIMQEVTRVFLGAASVLSNGTVYSRVGTASVAMVAHAFSIPVMICCETYKFHERVQLDSITANELGDPDALVNVCGRRDLKDLEGWSPEDKHLQLLNLTYDATPSDYVSMVITELGMVPPSSVPVILREYRRELPS
ncbi:hypothetical protein R1sor_013888 [Riccia sorocarpa]|uniref:Translation initiation factor eIF2B subunit delta n=1 Tax=Riccia sorocarpa TaxID=122646 RepID=A0ABD3HBP6_9MARC